MKKIMFVDDESDQIRSMQIVFEKQYGDKYQIIPAKSGADCFRLLKNDEIPDLILLDIMMPEETGWEVYNKLKARPQWKEACETYLSRTRRRS